MVLIGTGGTIGNLGRHAPDWEYMDHSPREEPAALLARVPEATRETGVIPVRFRALSSPCRSPRLPVDP